MRKKCHFFGSLKWLNSKFLHISWNYSISSSAFCADNVNSTLPTLITVWGPITSPICIVRSIFSEHLINKNKFIVDFCKLNEMHFWNLKYSFTNGSTWNVAIVECIICVEILLKAFQLNFRSILGKLARSGGLKYPWHPFWWKYITILWQWLKVGTFSVSPRCHGVFESLYFMTWPTLNETKWKICDETVRPIVANTKNSYSPTFMCNSEIVEIWFDSFC